MRQFPSNIDIQKTGRETTESKSQMCCDFDFTKAKSTKIIS